MAMLDRYRKPGGFVQLLTLMETCGPTKQEKFLELLRNEDSNWSEAIKEKMIDINRVYSWPDPTLAEVVGTLQDLCLAVAIHAAAPQLKLRLYSFLSHGRKRKIEELLERTPPTALEISTMHMKIIETVRKMAIDGFLRFEKFDSELVIEDDIEEKLAKAVTLVSDNVSSMFQIEYDTDVSEVSSTTKAESLIPQADDSRVIELSSLRKKVADMSKENAVLRHELSIVRGKLDQIKKIA